MAIYARTLTARGYRSYEDYELELADGITILVGRNAAGKTNLVEALQLLTSGQSFRRPAPRELLREGDERGLVRLTLEGEGRRIEHACELGGSRRAFVRNGKKTNASGVRGVLPSVLFCPDDLDMVKRSASVRRRALDDFGVQLNARYAALVSAYERVVEQRNNLLKERALDPSLLAAWDEALVANGAALMQHRAALLRRVASHAARAYEGIAPHERMAIAYEPSVFSVPAGAPDAPGATPDLADRAAVEELFRTRLAELTDDERRRGLTLVGPHRDEIAFTIDGRPARQYASQGQQRSLVLAWKIAEVAVTRDILGYAPLLLLDDVMSELDEQRRAAILLFIEGEVQTVITTTNLGYFNDDLLSRTKVVHIGEAR